MYDVLNFVFSWVWGELFYFFGDGFWAFLGVGMGIFGMCMGRIWDLGGICIRRRRLGKGKCAAIITATDGIEGLQTPRLSCVQMLLRQADYHGSLNHVFGSNACQNIVRGFSDPGTDPKLFYVSPSSI
jgi:hypothetical protein